MLLINPYNIKAIIKPIKIYNIIVVKAGKIEHTKVIINPAVRFPRITMPQVCQKLNPNITPTHVPVHTPVSGRGTATKANNPKAFNQSFLFSFLDVSSSTFSICRKDLS